MRTTRIIAALAATAFVSVAAHAQTTTLYDGSVTLPTGFETIDFSVGGLPATFMEGASIFNSADQGIGFLSGPSGYFKVFALTDGTTLTPLINSFSLTQAGSYSFTYDFANANSTFGDKVALTANITAVPEPATLAMLLTGLLGAGVVAGRTLRKSDPMSGAVPA